MSNRLGERVRAIARGGASRFLLNQVAHTTLTAAVLAALVFGAARVGALSRVLAPLAQESGSSFTTVNYQGRLADAAGAPVDNPNPGIGMTFALYDAETGGTPLWTETHANVPVSGGLFSVRLGSITALSADLLAGDRWLGIQIGSDAEMTPREKLSAVPYAMMAGTVMDGAISNVVQVHKRAADGSTDSSTFSDLPGELKVSTVTTENYTTLICTVNLSAYRNSDMGIVEYRLVLDDSIYGPDVNGFRYFFNENLSHRATSWQWAFQDVAPGNHTIRVEWRAVAGQIKMDLNDDLTLSVIELKK